MRPNGTHLEITRTNTTGGLRGSKGDRVNHFILLYREPTLATIRQAVQFNIVVMTEAPRRIFSSAKCMTTVRCKKRPLRTGRPLERYLSINPNLCLSTTSTTISSSSSSSSSSREAVSFIRRGCLAVLATGNWAK